MTIDVPTFCRIEYWDASKGDWHVGHSAINLMKPATYVQKLATRGVIARAINKDTGEEIYSEGGDLL